MLLMYGILSEGYKACKRSNKSTGSANVNTVEKLFIIIGKL